MKEPTRLAMTGRQTLLKLMVGSMILLASAAQGQEWPRFRGPNGQGISDAETIPVKWTETDYNWKIELPGGGHSSPVIWADKVFITSADQKSARGVLQALSVSDGKVLWQKEYKLTPYKMNKLNNYATGTPAVDAEGVYILWSTSEETILVSVDHDGRENWKRTFEGVQNQHGPACSPVVFDDIVVFTHEHENSYKDIQSSWFAADRRTGQTRWKIERQTGPKTSYSTPCIYPLGGPARRLVFASRSHGLSGVDPRTGTVAWEATSAFPSRVVSSPVIAGDLLIGTCGDGGSGKRLIAIRPGTGDNAEATEAYKIDNSSAPYVPTPLAKDNLLFTFHDRGDVSCLRSETGERLWREKPAGRYYGSPVWVNGNLYCMTIDGEVVVLKAAAKYELLAVNPLGEKTNATPAVAGGRMYLRTYSHLISIGGKK